MINTQSIFTDRLHHYMSRLTQQPSRKEATTGDLGAAAVEGENAGTRNGTLGEVYDAGVDPTELQTPSDVLVKLGQLPAEFVTRLLAENDGQLKQQAFTEYTDWSPSTITRLLQELEEDGHIVRVQIGIEKIVYLPENAPTHEMEPPVAPSTSF